VNKLQLLVSGLELAKEFCAANRLRKPGVELYDQTNWRFPSTCAYYRPVAIHIAPHRCAHIGRSGRAWSFPGYVIDRTPHGVVQHELGHHADHTRSAVKGAYGGDFSSAVRKAAGEPKLTNYCPNDWEWFAEMFRLFVTNSDLLRAVRPRTHAALVDAGFRPVVDRPWREVLAAAPDRTIEMAARKAA
jgi:hypothetical protein